MTAGVKQIAYLPIDYNAAYEIYAYQKMDGTVYFEVDLNGESYTSLGVGKRQIVSFINGLLTGLDIRVQINEKTIWEMVPNA